MGRSPILLASIRVTWNTIYFTVQTTLCVIVIILGKKNRAFFLERKAALRSAGVGRICPRRL